jgi:hypothetical protein
VKLEQLYDSQAQVRWLEDQLKLEENELEQYNGLPAVEFLFVYLLIHFIQVPLFGQCKLIIHCVGYGPCIR